jgi:hypothetical protein
MRHLDVGDVRLTSSSRSLPVHLLDHVGRSKPFSLYTITCSVLAARWRRSTCMSRLSRPRAPGVSPSARTPIPMLSSGSSPCHLGTGIGALSVIFFIFQELECLVDDLMENLAKSEQETTLGLVAKYFTETKKAQKSMFQVSSDQLG